ncbi:glucan biosynthesis protein [Jannaschia rubra]|uniref:Glucans biosynthesis protein G n=1 Tax=Jannaschia rubra TaxID=282197 RepID=A0A0M6XTC5_9RHOB|nr:glucan biosynthesis protein G [Jannaschia rubra]CTQ34360.1 Glucans biosynthesis protein G precursor [Jannaschia rubra]SFG62916.1 glucans biosynthesis protein [Jannaschia rubra]
MTRRGFLAGVSLLAMTAAAGAVTPRYLESTSFGPDTVHDLARDLAAQEFTARAKVPEPWLNLTYDEYRKIWFDVDNAVWSGTDLPFQMDLFHPGLYFPRPVEIDVVEDGQAHRLAFDIDLFTGTDDAPKLAVDETMGYSGLRLRHQFEGETKQREFAVFQGASYFRAIGAAQAYGLSARGLALRTGDPDGEEFPEFIRYWVVRPAPGDPDITVHALMDSPSVTGAFRFQITPGLAAEMRVDATLFPRVDLDHVGIAPLTSMFLYDQTNRPRFDDFRPAIHDSDGLLIWNGAGEMLWRQLANPTELQVSSFVDEGPRGFGLMQRARRLSDFADLEAHYQDRPSLWIEPEGDWGPGVVRLVEIPSDKEIYDNIVAYWRPHAVLAAGSEHRFAYRMIWTDEVSSVPPPRRQDVARVIDTHIGQNFDRDRTIVAIDFAAHPALDVPELEGQLDGIAVYVASGQAETSAGILQRNPETGGARLAFTFDPGDSRTVELRAQLFRDGAALSEAWLYRWTSHDA